jgi:hypothetical protein
MRSRQWPLNAVATNADTKLHVPLDHLPYLGHGSRASAGTPLDGLTLETTTTWAHSPEVSGAMHGAGDSQEIILPKSLIARWITQQQRGSLSMTVAMFVVLALGLALLALCMCRRKSQPVPDLVVTDADSAEKNSLLANQSAADAVSLEPSNSLLAPKKSNAERRLDESRPDAEVPCPKTGVKAAAAADTEVSEGCQMKAGGYGKLHAQRRKEHHTDVHAADGTEIPASSRQDECHNTIGQTLVQHVDENVEETHVGSYRQKHVERSQDRKKQVNRDNEDADDPADL